MRQMEDVSFMGTAMWKAVGMAQYAFIPGQKGIRQDGLWTVPKGILRTSRMPEKRLLGVGSTDSLQNIIMAGLGVEATGFPPSLASAGA